MRFVYLAIFLLLGACATKPTVVVERPERKVEAPSRMLEPAKITKETLVIDARPRFEYSLAHVPRSIPLAWTDFTEAERAQRGILQADVFEIARRLARYGIEPTSQIVVVGQGKNGAGEEGRIAWMLAYLGVSRVQFADLASFRVNLTNMSDETQLKSAPMWKPDPIESLNVPRAELLFAINERGVERPVSYKGAPAVQYRIIDVRSEKAYLGREGVKAPNMDAINIPWREFFESDMRPKVDMGSRLETVGVLPQQRVIVLSEDGVSSAAVTMALRALGYSRAGNYSGGVNDLMSAPR